MAVTALKLCQRQWLHRLGTRLRNPSVTQHGAIELHLRSRDSLSIYVKPFDLLSQGNETGNWRSPNARTVCVGVHWVDWTRARCASLSDVRAPESDG